MKTKATVDVKLLQSVSASKVSASVIIEDRQDRFYIIWTVSNLEGNLFGAKSFGISKSIINGSSAEDFLPGYTITSINRARSDRKYLFAANNWAWIE